MIRSQALTFTELQLPLFGGQSPYKAVHRPCEEVKDELAYKVIAICMSCHDYVKHDNLSIRKFGTWRAARTEEIEVGTLRAWPRCIRTKRTDNPLISGARERFTV